MLDILEELRCRELGLVLDAPQRGDDNGRSSASRVITAFWSQARSAFVPASASLGVVALAMCLKL